MRDTLILELYGGPGTGKSTTAAGLFYKLKSLGIDCELVREYAKDLVWEERKLEFDNQFIIFGKQLKKIVSCYGKVDILITDSPLLLGGYYFKVNKNSGYSQEVIKALMKETAAQFNSEHIFLQRAKKYNPNGRLQTESEAKNIDHEIKGYLDDLGISYSIVVADETVIDNLLALIKNLKPELFTV